MPSPPLKPADPFRYFHSSPEVIRMVAMLYVRFPLSLRNVEDLLFVGSTCVMEPCASGGTGSDLCSLQRSIGSELAGCGASDIGNDILMRCT